MKRDTGLNRYDDKQKMEPRSKGPHTNKGDAHRQQNRHYDWGYEKIDGVRTRRNSQAFHCSTDIL